VSECLAAAGGLGSGTAVRGKVTRRFHYRVVDVVRDVEPVIVAYLRAAHNRTPPAEA
jgi:hypothetical protein